MENKDLKTEIMKKALEAKSVTLKIANSSFNNRKEILENIALELDKNISEILFQNEIDVEAAKESLLSEAFVDRLTLNEKRIKSMITGVRDISKQPDPLGEVLSDTTRPSGISIKKIRVPIGLIGIVYESRPNVTIDSAVLCIFSGNSIILKGGREASNTNSTLVKILHNALIKSNAPSACVQYIESPSRESVYDLISLHGIVDVIIPRGNKEMIKEIVEKSKVPVIAHGPGICHTYVDTSADIDMAVKICVNAKVSRPSACNAMETLLVHKDIATVFLPKLKEEYDKYKVEIRGCPRTKEILKNIKDATEDDWKTEYLDLIISIKIVNNVEEAILHINKYGTSHSEAIVTENNENKNKFFSWIDAACLYHNASTRFTDGGEFGLGAEIGISTQKIHARGPMGALELTSYKYLITGKGAIRE